MGRKLQAGTSFEFSTSRRVCEIWEERVGTLASKIRGLLCLESKRVCIPKAFEAQHPCCIVENLRRAGNELSRPQIDYFNDISFFFSLVLFSLKCIQQARHRLLLALLLACEDKQLQKKNDYYFTLLNFCSFYHKIGLFIESTFL